MLKAAIILYFEGSNGLCSFVQDVRGFYKSNSAEIIESGARFYNFD
ncbi:hypothetical protein [Helicobacter jaachi]|nr:hypothetical protein [Helicobacter jaachi]